MLIGKPEGKRPAVRPRRRCEDNITDLKGTVYEDVDWIHVVHDREQRRILVNTVMNIRVS